MCAVKNDRHRCPASHPKAAINSVRAPALGVDGVLESADGRIVGVEVKAGSAVRSAGLSGLRHLADRTGSRFVAGYVLYTGQQTLPFGDGLRAMSIDALWTLSPWCEHQFDRYGTGAVEACDYRTMVEDSDWTMVGEQVRQARLGAGMSQAELATLVGLDRTMIAKVEAGTRRVDALELIRLAAALDVPIDHLLERRPAVISRRAELLADDNDTDVARRSQRLEITLSAWLRDVRQMVDAGTLQANAPMRYDGRVESETDARLTARWLRETHGASSRPIETLMEFSERSGQYVLVSELPGDGASLIDDDIAVAVISLNGDPGRRRATAAHELGRLVLGDEYSSDLAVHLSRADREDIINAFAAELLLPVAAFSASNSSGALRDDVIRLAARYRTSWSLALRQAEQAGWIDAVTRRKWTQVTPTRAEFMDAVGWSPQPDLDAVRVPPGFSHAVMQAWRRDLVTDSRAVELLHGQIGPEDLPPRDETDLALSVTGSRQAANYSSSTPPC